MIVLNGKHHLIHKNYMENLLINMVDHLVIVEGAVNASIGSAAWTGQIPTTFQNNGRSIDGTVEYLKDMDLKYENLHVIIGDGFWTGKDQMVNVAIDKIKEITNDCFLWEIDSDEHWTKWKMDEIESEMVAESADCVEVMLHQMMGHRLQAYGQYWGGNTCFRLWNWKGQRYKMHAPPILEGGNGKVINVHQRFVHYSYHFANDVKFKGDWYYKDLNVFPNWKNMQRYENDKFPVPLGDVLARYKKYDTFIYKIPNKNIDFKWTRWIDVDEADPDVLKNVDLNKVPVIAQNQMHNLSALFNIGRQLFKYRQNNIIISNYDKKYEYQVQIIKNGIDNLGMDHTVEIVNSNDKEYDFAYVNGGTITSEDVENLIQYRKDSGYIYISDYDKHETVINLLLHDHFENEMFKEFLYIPCHNGACLIL